MRKWDVGDKIFLQELESGRVIQREYMIINIRHDPEEKKGNSKKSYVVVAKEHENNKLYLLKFCDYDDISMRNNLIRESEFKFYYPYIEHVYGKYEFVDDFNVKYYCVKCEFIDGKNLFDYYNNKNDDEIAESYVVDSDGIEQDLADRFRHILQMLMCVRYYMQYADEVYLHRDIKPENFMVEEETKTLKLIDFDSAHIAESTRTISDIGKKNIEDRENWSIPISYGFGDPMICVLGDEIDEETKTILSKEYNLTREQKKELAIKCFTTPILEIYSLGLVMFFILTGKIYFPRNDEYIHHEDLAYNFKTERFERVLNVERKKGKICKEDIYKDQRFAPLVEMLQHMICPPKERYKTIEEVFSVFSFFLESYYKKDWSKVYEMLRLKQYMPLQSDKSRYKAEKPMKVRYTIQKKGQCANTEIEQKLLFNNTILEVYDTYYKNNTFLNMMLCNFDKELSFIPFGDFRRKQLKEKEDYLIKNGDTFLSGDYEITVYL